MQEHNESDVGLQASKLPAKAQGVLKEHFGRFAVLKLLLLVGIIVFAVVALITQPWNYMIYQGKISKIKLDMTKEEVQEILGEAYEINDDEEEWYYFDAKFAKEYEEYRQLAEADDIEGTLEKYREIAKIKHTFTKISFINDKVVEVIYDKGHFYSMFDEYKSESIVDSVEIQDPIAVLHNQKTGDYSLLTTVQKCKYHAKLSKGGFVKGLLLWGSSLTYDFSYDEEKIDLSWEDQMFTYVASEKLVVNRFDEFGCYSLGEGMVEINDTTVSSISEQIVKLEVSSSVTSISETALQALTNLRSVTVNDKNSNYRVFDNVLYRIEGNTKEILWVSPDISGSITVLFGVEEIDKEFGNAVNVTEIFLPVTVSKISDDAFENCINLCRLESANQEARGFFSHDGILYYYSSLGVGYIEHVPRRISGEIEFPQGVRSIGDGAFSGCTGLTSITIPASVTRIGKDAFSGCTSIIQKENGVSYVDKWVIDCDTFVTAASLRSDVVGIGDGAFDGCTFLTSITIPTSVRNIGFSAFSGCTRLTSMSLPFVGANKDAYDVSTKYFGYIFGASAKHFSGDHVPSSLKEVNITGGSSIPWGAFEDCTSLASVTIGDSVTSIGGLAFQGCTSLTSINIPDSVTSIDTQVFFECESLTSVTFGDSSQLASIGYRAFYRCSSLTSIEIPDSVANIDAAAFYGCTSLASITIPDSVTSIGDDAFGGCQYLASVTFENPNGWYVTTTQNATTGTNVTLTDAAHNAIYLKSKSYYLDYYWYRK